MTTTSVNPTVYAKETLLGMTKSLEQRFGCTPRNDLGTTLNTKFGVFPTLLPSNPCYVKYFCWGVDGRLNDTNNTTTAQYVLGTNMALYGMRPFRAVPLEQDLDATTRAQYAMRQVTTINGTVYCLYYLKLINFTQGEVQYTRTDPTTGTTSAYSLDYTNLSPTAPVVGDNGVITDVADQISITLPGTMTITGQEVLESASVIDGGDMRYATVSELGFVSASTQSVSANSYSGTPFSYNEAIMAQLTSQYNFSGFPFSSTTDVMDRTINFSLKNAIMTS